MMNTDQLVEEIEAETIHLDCAINLLNTFDEINNNDHVAYLLNQLRAHNNKIQESLSQMSNSNEQLKVVSWVN